MSVPIVCKTVYFKRGTSDKFYRTWEIEGWFFAQNGRRGASGSFHTFREVGADAAAVAADNCLFEKMQDGYGQARTDRFTITPTCAFGGEKDEAKTLDAERRLRFGDDPYPDPTPIVLPEDPTPATAPFDRISAHNARLLAAISLAVTDKEKAVIELAHLNEEHDALVFEFSRAASYLSTLYNLIEA